MFDDFLLQDNDNITGYDVRSVGRINWQPNFPVPTISGLPTAVFNGRIDNVR